MDNIRVGIVGATGYTGSELSRLLLGHPQVEVVVVTSESRQGADFTEAHPFLHGMVQARLESMEHLDRFELDVVFLGLPHGVSMEFVAKHYPKGHFRIIDLSGDFRLGDVDAYESWYGREHIYPEGVAEAVYGIPEFFPEAITNARLIGNPGCFPTGALLGLAPLVTQRLVAPQIVVDAKTGVTGAGIKASDITHFANVYDNFRAYGLKTHRHTIEIEGCTTQLAGGGEWPLQFQPHLLPVDRGILSAIYTRPQDEALKRDPMRRYADFYAGCPFVRLLDRAPTIKNVRGSNFCDIFATYDERTGYLLTFTAIDNLVRGAAGQAVQNMNLMFGLEPTTGLWHPPLFP